MTIYRLWRQLDNQTFEAEARDDEHALKVFEQKLGLTFTFEEGHVPPEYMMGRIKKEPGWTPAPDIPVYEVH